eukprot:1159711-Pelagomonas_calceolata.AAC.2
MAAASRASNASIQWRRQAEGGGLHGHGMCVCVHAFQQAREFIEYHDAHIKIHSWKTPHPHTRSLQRALAQKCMDTLQFARLGQVSKEIQ